MELAKKGIIREEFAGEMELPESLSTEDEGQAYVAGSDGSAEADDMSDVSVSPDVLDVTTASVSKLLAAVTRGCAGQSGRALRKLPLKAHAFYSQTPVVGFRDFLAALYSAVSEDQGEVGRDVRV